ncbi:MAG TPA: hypothetical protein DHW71_03545 [Gammaproteobacteria bacterium]|nr:hypothetical protein [Gammaproteobacteria bacterium]MEC8011247.1 hypothetical protein [Pseudomonadota bacterium]HCK92033.1 hypothetical protein [Gammaproteobacteria bacterium]|tara:strand:+ start:1777 stop:2367 length:591 start_codon:yes stop_codon:yes gene_type:complete
MALQGASFGRTAHLDSLQGGLDGIDHQSDSVQHSKDAPAHDPLSDAQRPRVQTADSKSMGQSTDQSKLSQVKTHAAVKSVSIDSQSISSTHNGKQLFKVKNNSREMKTPESLLKAKAWGYNEPEEKIFKGFKNGLFYSRALAHEKEHKNENLKDLAVIFFKSFPFVPMAKTLPLMLLMGARNSGEIMHGMFRPWPK